MAYNDNKNEELDEKKLAMLKLRVYSLERDNSSTCRLKDNEVVERIVKMITTEVQNDN